LCVVKGNGAVMTSSFDHVIYAIALFINAIVGRLQWTSDC